MKPSWEDARVRRGMEQLLKLRDERVAAGDRTIGWKIAFAAPSIQQQLGLGGPLAGFLVQSRALASGSVISLAGWTQPVFEAEIAVTMGQDLGSGADDAAAAAAVAGFGPAIELIDVQHPSEELERLLSGNIAHRHVVLGPPDARRDGPSVDGLRARVFRRGAEVASTSDVQVLGMVRYLADYLAAFGERLRAGEVVICGAIVPPIVVEPDESEIVYRLEPLGEVSARFGPPPAAV